MATDCQSSYEKSIKHISEARKSGSRDAVKNALLDFVDALSKVCADSRDNRLAFSDFIYDPEMLFRTSEKKESSLGVEIDIKTNGLLAQALEVFGVSEFQVLSDRIKNAIEDVHSKLSRGSIDPSEAYGTLEESIKSLRQAIS